MCTLGGGQPIPSWGRDAEEISALSGQGRKKNVWNKDLLLKRGKDGCVTCGGKRRDGLSQERGGKGLLRGARSRGGVFPVIVWNEEERSDPGPLVYGV